VNEGLLGLLNHYIAVYLSFGWLLKSQGRDAARYAVAARYMALIDWVADGGLGDFPEPVDRMTVDQLISVQSMTLGGLFFVIAHELAHARLGHLAGAGVRSTPLASPDASPRVELFALSRQEERDADDLAWDWYCSSWRSIPWLQDLEPAWALTAPLLFFCLCVVFDGAPRDPDPLSTHPPPLERLARIADRMPHEEAATQALGILQWAKVIPGLWEIPRE
jgi:hypothetical protein